MGDGVENRLAINERKMAEYLSRKIPRGEVTEIGKEGVYEWPPKKKK